MDRESAEGIWLKALGRLRLTGYIPHAPTPKQRAFLVMPHREVLFGGAAGGGKQVKTDQIMEFWQCDRGDCDGMTPVIDTADSIVVGDYLIGSDGKPKRVLARSIPEYREFYRVSFDDGTCLDVSDEHLWTVFDLSKRGPGHESRGWWRRTVTTEWLFGEGLKYRHQSRFAIPLIDDPVDPPEPERPTVPPYTLGYWFGNGCKQASTLTCHIDDVEAILSNIEAEVGRKEYRVYDEDSNRATILIRGWNAILRAAAWPCSKVEADSSSYYVFLRDRMPVRWRFWSVEDRRSLLAGLLDSDGHATKRGDVEFDSTSPSLAYLVYELFQSLGMKPASPTRRVGRSSELPTYRVCCTATEQVFRLSRKAERLNLGDRQLRQSRRYIVGVEPIGVREGVCFTVDSEDHLYVAGSNYILTHNSDALLMAALQHVDLPEYTAILFRKTFSDLSLPGALIPRSHEWLSNSDARWNQTRHEWTFPSGAKLAFGYLEHEVDKYRYQGAEFNFIGFDELTQFPEDDYLYLHSRLRRLSDSTIPLRIRCATNPGGVGHKWVKDRFGIGKVVGDGVVRYIGGNRDRPYIPAFVRDNPYLSRDEYEDVLGGLDPVTREQLLRGDWGVTAEGRFRKSWVKYFSTRGVNYILGEDGRGQAVHGKDVELMMLVDPAASVKSGPGDKSIWRKSPSQTVIGLFGRTMAHNHLLWIDCDHGRWEIPDVLDNIVSMYRRWEPSQIGIEASGLGIGVVTMLEQAGLPVKRLSPKSQDKLVRATDACNRMERGMVWLPQTAPWLDDVETELFTWTGHPDEPDDFVDVLSYAAKEVSVRAMDQSELLKSTIAYNVPHAVGGHGGDYEDSYYSGM